MQEHANSVTPTVDTGQLLRNLLEKKGFSQAHFAGLLGISKARLNNYITNRSEADYATLRQIARLLNVSTDFLLGMERQQEGSEQPPLLMGGIRLQTAMPESRRLEVVWLPVYRSYANLAAIEARHEGELHTPVGWYAVPSGQPENNGALNRYALLIDDDSMSPTLDRGDLVIVQATLFSHTFLSNNPYDEMFSVRLLKADKIGCALKRCIVQDNLLLCSTDNKACDPVVIDMNKTTYIPIVGFVTAVCKGGARGKNHV